MQILRLIVSAKLWIRTLVTGAVLMVPLSSMASDIVITGVVDGPLSGGIPKGIELCVLADIPDLSVYGVGSANNGGGSDGEEFTFPADSASAGTYIYIASEDPGFSSFFGFSPDYTSGAMGINGDDAIELFMAGAVVDVFGDINTDGSGQPWEYMDGWAYRADGSGPDGTAFVLGNWSFSGPNALDGETSNATAVTPFPIGSYSACMPTEPEPPVPALLLTEVLVTPTGGEFIEIFNPTSAAVDLSNVYLTDATFAGGGVFYYNIVTGADAGGGGFGDFHARFPDGASIGPGAFQTVSIAGSDGYLAAYGIAPDYELFEDAAAADAVPDMREALPGSIGGQGGLTNSGEVVVLYSWDGNSDLVADIDYLVWGDKAEAVDKTGVSIDGPDADPDVTLYNADTAIGAQDVVLGGAHPFGNSFQRIDFAEGAESQSGGNGVTGSNEMSEDLSLTWSSDATPTPGAAPPAPAAEWIINEIHADPDGSAAGDANGDGTRDGVDDEFVEIVNVSGADADISGWTVADGFTVRHTFPSGTVVPDGCSVVVFGGGTPIGAFGRSVVQTASDGLLGFNNGGDTVTLNNGLVDIAQVSYGSEGGDNQSLTRDPDVTGSGFVKHSLATTSGGALYSPGSNADGSQFSGCPSPWVINEIHADPAGDISGDANGDGARSASQDEFVEIVNFTGEDADISGWTLADGASLRHTFPAGSVVPKGCAVVVFGGGVPSGTFGNAVVQTASGGSLGLNNGGDTLTLNDGSNDVSVVGYGSDGGDNQSLTLQPEITGVPPYIKHSVAGGSGGTLFSPGTLADGMQFIGCPVSAAVYDIQGSGDVSPLEGRLVETEGVVTALGTDGFFIQMSDGDPATSDGIFVFTGGAPTVAVGDQVDVTGEVAEFFGFTEITGNPKVTVTGPGVVPAPVIFDATRPSPSPDAPSCTPEFECYEGMLVQIADGTVTASNQRFGVDPIAEVFITAAPARTYREPGVEAPGVMMPPIPTWDGNPEVFELDPDRLGLPNQIIPAGSSFSATGVLGFEFGGYELWPTELLVSPAPLPVPVRAREAGEVTVGSLNLFRLFDDIDDPVDLDGRNDAVVATAEYQRRLAKFCSYISGVLGSPDILAVQEVESLKVLQDLADVMATDATCGASVNYTPLLVEGNDVGTIDVGFMVRDSISVNTLTQLGKNETYVNPVNGMTEVLHDRPPLLLEASCATEFGAYPLSVMVVHNRSLGGIDGNEGERVRVKRLRQAESIANKVQTVQAADAEARLVVVGDFNDFEFTDGYADALNVIAGSFDPDTSLVCSEAVCAGDLVEPDLDIQTLWLPENERYSFIFRGNAQALDHALATQSLAAEISGFEYGRGNADAAVDLINNDGSIDPSNASLRSSDHDGFVLFVNKDEDNDGVPNNVDLCPGTTIPEAVPSKRLGNKRYALLEGDLVFDIGVDDDSSSDDGSSSDDDSSSDEPLPVYTTGDTGGCSCEQILDAMGKDQSQRKLGCKKKTMKQWVAEAGANP